MRLVFMGTPEFAVPALCTLLREEHDIAAVVTRPDRPRRRKSAPPGPSPVKREACRAGLHVLEPASVKEPSFTEQLRQLAPETIVVVAFGQILPPAVLRIPPRWCINLHASILPRYRGAAPVARAIMAGETQTGVTTMKMDEGLDTGDILLQRRCAIDPGETAGELTEKLATVGAVLLAETLSRHAGEGLFPAPQDGTAATLAPPMTKGDRLIDWSAGAASISARVRACNPWPVAVADLRGERVQILRAEVANEEDRARQLTAAPGVVLDIDDARVLVQCGGATLLALRQLRFPGRRAISARDARNGRLIRVGDRFAASTAG